MNNSLLDRVLASATKSDGRVLTGIVVVVSLAAVAERLDARVLAAPLVLIATLWPLVAFVPLQLWTGRAEDLPTRSRTVRIFIRASLGVMPTTIAAAIATSQADGFPWAAATVACAGLVRLALNRPRGVRAPTYLLVGASCGGLAIGTLIPYDIGWDSLAFFVYALAMALSVKPDH